LLKRLLAPVVKESAPKSRPLPPKKTEITFKPLEKSKKPAPAPQVNAPDPRVAELEAREKALREQLAALQAELERVTPNPYAFIEPEEEDIAPVELSDVYERTRAAVAQQNAKRAALLATELFDARH
jgi:hypothetical protein